MKQQFSVSSASPGGRRWGALAVALATAFAVIPLWLIFNDSFSHLLLLAAALHALYAAWAIRRNGLCGGLCGLFAALITALGCAAGYGVHFLLIDAPADAPIVLGGLFFSLLGWGLELPRRLVARICPWSAAAAVSQHIKTYKGMDYMLLPAYERVAGLLHSPPHSILRCRRPMALLRVAWWIPAVVLYAIYAEVQDAHISVMLPMLTFLITAPFFVGYFGFLRGGLCSLICSMAALAGYGMVQVILSAWHISIPVAVLLALAGLVLFGFGIFYGVRQLIRIHFWWTQMFVRDNVAHLVLWQKEPNRFAIVKPGLNELWQITLTFEPFPQCEKYFFITHFADIAMYCQLHGMALAGMTVRQDAPQISYYLYTAPHPRMERKLTRYFSRLRHSTLRVEHRPDPEGVGYNRFLPSLEELFQIYNEMLIPCLKEKGQMQRMMFSFAFDHAADAERFAERIRAKNPEWRVLVNGKEHSEPADPEWESGTSVDCIGEMLLEVYTVTHHTTELSKLAKECNGELYLWDNIFHATHATKGYTV